MQALSGLISINFVSAAAIGILVLNSLRSVNDAPTANNAYWAINATIAVLAALSWVFQLQTSSRAQVRLWVALLGFIIAQLVLDHSKNSTATGRDKLYDWINLGLAVGAAAYQVLFIAYVPIAL